MRFSFDYDNDGDQKRRAWVVGAVLVAVILGELLLLTIVVSYLVLAVDFTPLR
jgi:hypothetical protein